MSWLWDKNNRGTVLTLPRTRQSVSPPVFAQWIFVEKPNPFFKRLNLGTATQQVNSFPMSMIKRSSYNHMVRDLLETLVPVTIMNQFRNEDSSECQIKF